VTTEPVAVRCSDALGKLIKHVCEVLMEELPLVEDPKLFALTLQFNCPAKWSKMKGDDKIRFCNTCQKNVYNVSRMSKQDAIDLITEKEGNLCVRFYQRRDGTVVTQDCLSILGTARLRAKYPILAVANAGLASMALSLLPMLGPAVVTILNGVGPMMQGTGSCRAKIETNHFKADSPLAKLGFSESFKSFVNSVLP
jgi:hypothetical protein